MFGISLFASVIIIAQIWSRLVTHKPGPAVMVLTLWIVLGPLGQSVTAAGNLGAQAAHVLPQPYRLAGGCGAHRAGRRVRAPVPADAAQADGFGCARRVTLGVSSCFSGGAAFSWRVAFSCGAAPSGRAMAAISRALPT
jgi:tellurite resistance protein TehA-like permease